MDVRGSISFNNVQIIGVLVLITTVTGELYDFARPRLQSPSYAGAMCIGLEDACRNVVRLVYFLF